MASKAEVAVRDVDKAIIIKKGDGEISRIVRRLVLSEEDGTLVKLPMNEKIGNDWVKIRIPSAKGFMAMAANCGMFIDHPETVIVDGVAQPNGYRHPVTKEIYCRTRAAGYTDSGQPFLTDRTVVYDVNLYNIQDLVAKANQKENVAFFKLAAKRRDEIGNYIPPKGCEDWAGYEIDEALVLWMDPSAPSATSWIREMVNRKKNAVRTCQTFSDRNAIAAHPSLPTKRKFLTDTAVVECSTWYATKGNPTWAGTTLQIDAQKLLAEQSGVEVGVDVSDEPIDITAQVEEVKAEAQADDTDPDAIPEQDEINEEEATESGEEQQEESPEADPQYDALVQEVKKLKGMKPAGQWKKACDSLEIVVKKEADLMELPLAKLNQLYGLLKA